MHKAEFIVRKAKDHATRPRSLETAKTLYAKVDHHRIAATDYWDLAHIEWMLT